jgi:hypothetical protein
MPNWCENTVTIRHDDQDKLIKLHEAMIAGNFLKTVIPIPEELKNELTSSYGGEDKEFKDKLRSKLKKKYGYESWYDFCIARWGTKWDVEIFEPELNDKEILAYFNSAWSPPIGVYEELTRQGFDVDAKYCEFGMGFAGTYSSEEGECHYGFNDLPDDLDKEFGISNALKEIEEEV